MVAEALVYTVLSESDYRVCLVQVMGDELKPFLAGLRVSKIKLVTAYVDQAQAQRRRFAAQSSQA